MYSFFNDPSTLYSYVMKKKNKKKKNIIVEFNSKYNMKL